MSGSNRGSIEFKIPSKSKVYSIWRTLTSSTPTVDDKHPSGNLKFETIFSSKKFMGLFCPKNLHWVFPLGYCTNCHLGMSGKCGSLNQATRDYSFGKFSYSIWYTKIIKVKRCKNRHKMKKPSLAIQKSTFTDQGISGKLCDLNSDDVSIKLASSYYQIEGIFEIHVELTTEDTDSGDIKLPNKAEFLGNNSGKIFTTEEILMDPNSIVEDSKLYQLGKPLQKKVKVVSSSLDSKSKTKSKSSASKKSKSKK